MNVLFSIAFSLLCVQMVDGSSWIDEKIRETLLPPRSNQSDISWVTDENRELVVGRLLAKLDVPSEHSSRYIEEALVRVGHERTIIELIEKKMRNPRLKLGALSETNEVAIPHAMPLVYSGSTEDPNTYGVPGNDVIALPVRNFAVGLVLGSIRRSEKFPAETRQWAEKMGNWHDPNSKGGYELNERYVALLTSWWERNQAAILEKRYADATWLPRYKGRPSTLDVEEMAERERDRRHLWIGFSLFVGLALAFCFWRTSVRAA